MHCFKIWNDKISLFSFDSLNLTKVLTESTEVCFLSPHSWTDADSGISEVATVLQPWIQKHWECKHTFV